MRLIFLDLKGTLVIPSCHSAARLLQRNVAAFQPAVEALNHIIDETQGQLVITSQEKVFTGGNMKTNFTTWGLNSTSFDRTPNIAIKGRAILEYLSIAGEPDGFVIIDATSEGYGNLLRNYLIVTDPESGGLTMALAHKAVKIFKKMDK